MDGNVNPEKYVIEPRESNVQSSTLGNFWWVLRPKGGGTIKLQSEIYTRRATVTKQTKTFSEDTGIPILPVKTM